MSDEKLPNSSSEEFEDRKENFWNFWDSVHDVSRFHKDNYMEVWRYDSKYSFIDSQDSHLLLLLRSVEGHPCFSITVAAVVFLHFVST